MSDTKNSLEIYLVEKFKEIGIKAHRTAGSGCGDRQKSDISNPYFQIEAKIKHSHENIIVDYKNEYLKTIDQMPRKSNKTVVIATEQKFGERFITMSAEDFFKLVAEAKRDETN